MGDPGSEVERHGKAAALLTCSCPSALVVPLAKAKAVQLDDQVLCITVEAAAEQHRAGAERAVHDVCRVAAIDGDSCRECVKPRRYFTSVVR